MVVRPVTSCLPTWRKCGQGVLAGTADSCQGVLAGRADSCQGVLAGTADSCQGVLAGISDHHNVGGGQDEAMGAASLVVLRQLKSVAKNIKKISAENENGCRNLEIVIVRIPVGHSLCDVPVIRGPPGQAPQTKHLGEVEY